MNDLDICKQFNNVVIEERNKILQKKKLYFACFSPITEDYNAKNLQNQKKLVSRNNHPLGMVMYPRRRQKADVTTQGTFEEDKNLSIVDNGDKNSTATDLKSGSTGITSKITSMYNVSTRESHGETKKKISTFAMLITVKVVSSRKI